MPGIFAQRLSDLILYVYLRRHHLSKIGMTLKINLKIGTACIFLDLNLFQIVQKERKKERSVNVKNILSFSVELHKRYIRTIKMI